MKSDVDRNVRPLNRTAFGYANALMFAVVFLIVAGADQLQAQNWGVRASTPRLVSSGPLWINPTVVQGLRPDRRYSLVVTGTVKLGDEHYGRYYKGYYGDGGYRWESRAADINYPTQAPERSGVVATNLGIRLADAGYRQNHIYHTDWFVPPSSTMTIQLAVQPSQDNMGQIHFSLMELHPDVSPSDYTFNSTSGTWHHDSEFFGQPPQGMRPQSLWDAIAVLPPHGVRPEGIDNLFSSGNAQPVVWNEPQGVCTDTTHDLFSSDDNQPGGSGVSGGFYLPPFPGNNAFPPSNSGFGPADVDLAPGFSATAPPRSPGRSTSNGNSINLLDQIAPPVRY